MALGNAQQSELDFEKSGKHLVLLPRPSVNRHSEMHTEQDEVETVHVKSLIGSNKKPSPNRRTQGKRPTRSQIKSQIHHSAGGSTTRGSSIPNKTT